MEILLIIFTAIVVIVFTVISFYTSVNSGAGQFEDWLRRWNKPNKD
jgi:succinate dehydrogenase hydrophobic anchor subunit